MTLDNFRNINIVIDRANFKPYQNLFVSQGDYDGRSLTVQVTDNGVIKEQVGLQLNLWWQNEKAGNQGLDNFTLINADESIFSIDFPNSMLTPGSVKASIQLLQDGLIIMTYVFTIRVQQLYGNAYAVIKENSFSTLTSALAEANRWRYELDNKTDLKTIEDMLKKLPTGTPKETFKSLAELNAKYPDGDESAMIVLESDGKTGYVYTWDGSAWIKGAMYPSPTLEDKSIKRPKTSFSTYYAAQNILGTINIDSINGKVTCTNNVAAAFGTGYKYPNAAQEVILPLVTSPVYIGFSGKNLVATTGTELEDPDATPIATFYQGKVYAFDYRNISLNGVPLDNMDNSEGVILYGDIDVYFDEKKIIVREGTVVTSNRGNFHFASEGDTELTYETDTPSLYLVANKRSQSFELSTSIFPESQIILGELYRGRFYKSSPRSRITCYPLDDIENVGSLSFIDFGLKIEITDTDDVKTIKIPAGQTPLDNRSGLYYRNAYEYILDFKDFTNPTGAVMSVFLKPSFLKNSNGRYYVEDYYIDYSPKNVDDIKVFSYYKNKVYGVDDVTRSMITVNGVKNGGFGSLSEKTELKYNSINEWFSKAAIGSSSKILWIGDSTWYGSTGDPNEPKTVPFCERLQQPLDNYFGTGKVVSANESIGGKTITYFAEEIENLLTQHNDADIVMIGAALNGISATTTETRRTAFETIVQACFKRGMLPVLGTAQAHQVPFTETGDNWVNRSQYNTEKYDRPLRLGIAEKYRLEVIDFTEFTQRIIDNAPESITELVPDMLHGSGKLHEYQTDWTFSQLVPAVKNMYDTGIVSMYDMKVLAGRSHRNIKNISKDSDGFKSQWDFTANQGDVLFDAWLYLEPEETTKWNILASLNAGSLKVNVNEAVYSISGTGKQNIVSGIECGLYHVVVKADAGAVKFKGLICELSK